MKITVTASGTRGDVQPYIALGKGLHDAGHQVRVISSEDFAGLAHDAGLEFASLGESVEALLQSDAWRTMTESGNFVRIVRGMMAAMKDRASVMARLLPNLLAGSELIVAGLAGMGGTFSIADRLKIPIVQAYVFPLTPTRAFPSPLFPALPFGQILNRLSYFPMRQMLWQTSRAADAATRKTLGMGRPPLLGPYRTLQTRPVLYGYSRYVLPPPTDWGANQAVTGYWFLDAAPNWAPPPDLTDFLQAGPPPIYIGFGSMGNRDPERTTRIAIEALQRSGQRGILASGWGGMVQTDLPDSVFMLKAAPHSWLFPRMAAVVHHGGAGTTAAGLRAGIPSIVVPFFGDQPFWGKRVAALGVGPAPIPKKRLTAENLASAIQAAVSDQAMRMRAADLGEKIRAEDGAANAAAIIGQLGDRVHAGPVLAPA